MATKLTDTNLRKLIAEQIRSVTCFDEEERATKAQMLEWLATTPQFCRTSTKPDLPREHFALMTAFVAPDKRKTLLFEHKKSGLLLTNGGHLDIGETLQEGAVREAYEETGITLFSEDLKPFFLSKLDTLPEQSNYHWEVWFVATVPEDTDVTKGQDYATEFSGHRWYTLNEAQLLPDTHPHFARLIRKLKTIVK